MMTVVPDIGRPSRDLIEGLQGIGSATCAGELSRLGIRDPFLKGPVAWTEGRSIVGPALTLRFMPKREDMHGVGEYQDREKQLHRLVLYKTQPGDIVVVDARGDMASGVFGEILLTYFMGKGGIGVVIDGCIRDYPHAKGLDLGLWIRGVTPNYHTQTNIIPFAANVPVACGGVLVMPGDIIVGDDDGVVNVPVALAPELLGKAGAHAEWEEFTRLRLAQGGELRDYYPLSEAKWPEYEAWKREQGN